MNRFCGAARLGSVALAFALALAAGGAELSAAPAATRGLGQGQVRELITLVNRHRRARGLGALAWDERVARVAEAHSRDMTRRGFFDHENPDGHSPFDRLAKAGVRYRAAAENIAEGPDRASVVLDGWIGSTGHRRNLENPAYTHHGIGLHRGRWTHVLFRPR